MSIWHIIKCELQATSMNGGPLTEEEKQTQPYREHLSFTMIDRDTGTQCIVAITCDPAPARDSTVLGALRTATTYLLMVMGEQMLEGTRLMTADEAKSTEKPN